MPGEIHFIELPYKAPFANDIYLMEKVAELERIQHLDRLIITPKSRFPATENYCKNHEIRPTTALLQDKKEAEALYSSISGRFAQTTDTLTEDYRYWLEEVLKENSFSFQRFS